MRPPGAYAEYGQGAGVALPALLPSPIRPTGPMADTCEVVALGREDVCLEFKKVLTAYDNLQLSKSKTALTEAQEDAKAFKSRAEVMALLDEAVALVGLIERNALDDVAASVKAFDATTFETLAGTNEELAKGAKAVKADWLAVSSAAKAREASPLARAIIKYSKDLVDFVPGL